MSLMTLMIDSQWEKIYEKKHAESVRNPVELRFDYPIVIRPGEQVRTKEG